MRILGFAFGLMCGVAVGQGAPSIVPVPVVPATQVEKRPSDAAAAKTVFQAAMLLRQGNLDEAERQLDAARALNDQELRLWGTYGALHAARGDKAQAIADDKRELALHPDANEVYAALATLEEGLGRRADEELTLRTLIQAEPRSPAASARLLKMLVEDGKPAEAVTLGLDSAARFQAAVAAEPRLNPRGGDGLQFELSKAQAAAGMKAESLATLVALLKVTTNASILNDGAYRLAEEGIELPLAEKSARSALMLAEFNSRRVTMYTSPEITRAVIGQVAAVWDTLGWALFREGKLEEAQSYVRSSWLQNQSVGVGEHLAEIESARWDKNKALTVCEVSLVAAQKPVPKPAAKPIPKPVESKADPKADAAKPVETKADVELSAEMQAVADAKTVDDAKKAAEDLAKLQQTADGLKKAGAISKGQAGLKEMLTFALVPLRGVSGTGEFLMTLGFGIVETATATAKTNPTGMLTRLMAVKVGPGLWPAESGARLVMKAQVSCSKAGCVVVLGDL